MGSCGKHFHGHGFVEGDSHHVIPVDKRSLDELRADDLKPFAALAAAGMSAVMPAHVVYPAVEACRPVSRACADDHLRQRQGVCRPSGGGSPTAGRLLLRRPVQFLAAGLQRAFERTGAAILPERENRFYESDASGAGRGRAEVESSTEKEAWLAFASQGLPRGQVLELTGLQGVALTF